MAERMGEQSKEPQVPVDDRSSTAKALSKVSEITAACLLMIIPALIGIWLDRTFSTVMLFTVIGLIVGVTGAVLQLKRLVSSIAQPSFDPNKIIEYDDEEFDDASNNDTNEPGHGT